MADDDTVKQWTAISAMSEVAATMIRTASMIPIGALRTACDLQERAIDLMESFVPGAAPESGQASGGGGQSQPAAATRVSPTSTSATAAATAGWGPVTPQNPQTGWGPMPH